MEGAHEKLRHVKTADQCIRTLPLQYCIDCPNCNGSVPTEETAARSFFWLQDHCNGLCLIYIPGRPGFVTGEDEWSCNKIRW
jgi:hypothetical protein